MDAARRKFSEILQLCEQLKASDIHLTSGVVPYMRVRGEIVRASEKILSPFVLEQMAMAMMSDYQRTVFAKSLSIDFAFFGESGVRYRANVL